MKKLFCILTAVVLLFCILAPVTSAKSIPDLPENTPLFVESAINQGLIEYTDDIALKLEIYDRLYSALIQGQTVVDISKLKISYTQENFDEIISVFYYLLETSPYFYDYNNGIWNAKIVGTEPYIIGISYYFKNISIDYPVYSSQTFKDRFEFTKKSAANIAKKVPKNISDVAKMLWVHDYLAVNYKYDETLQIRSAYGFLSQKTGVCSSYAHTFTAIMTELGIPATSVYSDEGNHQWNVVLLDGKFYNIDCTWGDPTPDSQGAAYHNFFLISDDQLALAETESNQVGSHINAYTMESRYFGIDVSCTDTKYDSGYVWSNSNKAFTYYNGAFYYISNTTTNNLYPTATIYKTTNFKSSSSILTINSDLWYIEKNDYSYSYHPGFYSGFEIIGSQLYFNDSHSVKYYDLDNGMSGTVFNYNNDNIFSFHYLGKGQFSYTTHTHDNYHTDIENIFTLTDKGHIFDSYATNYTTDLAAMRKYLLGYHDDNICLVKGDISGDDREVTVQDFVALKKLAAQS